MDRSYSGQGTGAGWLPSNVDTYSYGGSTPPGGEIPPTVFGAYGFAWRVLWQHFGTLLLTVLVMILVEIPADIFSGLGNVSHGFTGMGYLYTLFVVVPVSYGLWYLLLRAVRGERPAVSDLFVPFGRQYWACLKSYLLFIICCAAGFLLFIIPGIIVSIRLSFMPFLVVDEEMSALQALKESWRRTRGHSWRIFGLYLLALPVALAGLLLLIVGIVPAWLWISLALSAFYASITARGAAASRPAVSASW